MRKRVGAVTVGMLALVIVGVLLITPMLAAANGVPTMWPSKPSTPATANHLYSVKVWGTLWPKVAAGTYPVRIYRWRKTSTGTWKSYGYVWARSYAYNSEYSKYQANVRLGIKGTWKLRAWAKAQTIGGKYYHSGWSDSFRYIKMY